MRLCVLCWQRTSTKAWRLLVHGVHDRNVRVDRRAFGLGGARLWQTLHRAGVSLEHGTAYLGRDDKGARNIRAVTIVEDTTTLVYIGAGLTTIQSDMQLTRAKGGPALRRTVSGRLERNNRIGRTGKSTLESCQVSWQSVLRIELTGSTAHQTLRPAQV